MNLAVEDIINFAKVNRGKSFRTAGGRTTFSVVPHSNGVKYFTTAGKGRFSNRDGLERYVAIFNDTGSFATTNYQEKLRNASYFLGVVRQILNGRRDAEEVLNSLPAEEQDILNAPETEREELRKSRLGQGKFRRELIKLRGACYVTGLADPEFLRASHIKPWSKSTNLERLDPHNGLLLSPNYDHLFDACLITFEDDGRMLISAKIPERVLRASGIAPTHCTGRLSGKTKAYLGYHRERFKQASKG